MNKEQSDRLSASGHHWLVVIAATGFLLGLPLPVGLFRLLPSTVHTEVPLALTVLVGIVFAVIKSRAFGIGMVLGAAAYGTFLLFLFASFDDLDKIG